LASARACNVSVVVQRLCMAAFESTAIQNNQKQQQTNSSIVFSCKKICCANVNLMHVACKKTHENV
jgi:hypothetical protein